MVFYPHHIIAWEQHDGQIPSLASRAHQTLGGLVKFPFGFLKELTDESSSRTGQVA